MTLDSAAIFDNWLEREQRETISKFNNKGGRGNTTYYHCNRSGDPNPKYDEYRQPSKSLDSYYAMGAQCPAYIKRVNNSDGTITVTYCSTHFGHICDFRWISRSPSKFVYHLDCN